MKEISSNSSMSIHTGGKVFLYLPLSKHKKSIMVGTINYPNKTYYSARKTKKHLFKKSNSLGLPLELIERKHSGFIFICVNYENKNLWTSRLAIFRHGEILHFKAKGFEKQIFLELSKWNNNKKQARIERIKIRKEL